MASLPLTQHNDPVTCPPIFDGISFVITGLSNDDESLYTVTSLITSHGGYVIRDFKQLVERNTVNDIILLSDRFHQRESFLLANVVEIPRLHIDYVHQCVTQSRLIPIVDNVDLRPYLLPRGILYGQTVEQTIPMSTSMMQKEMRVFAGLSFEVHPSSEQQHNLSSEQLLVRNLIVLGGGAIVKEHEEPDTETTKLILYDFDHHGLNSPMSDGGDVNGQQRSEYASVLERANRLSIFIINKAYVLACVIQGEVIEITSKYSPNIEHLLAESDIVDDDPMEDELPQQESQEEEETEDNNKQQQQQQQQRPQSPQEQQETRLVQSAVPEAVDEWIYDFKDRQSQLITGLKRTKQISSSQTKTTIFKLGDTVKLTNQRFVHICQFVQRDELKLFVCRKFTPASQKKASYIYELEKEELSIHLIDRKAAVYSSLEDFKNRKMLCVDRIVGVDKLVPLSPFEQIWSEKHSDAVLGRYSSLLAQSGTSHHDAKLKNLPPFIWFQPTITTHHLVEYDAFLFNGKSFRNKKFVRILNQQNVECIARITALHYDVQHGTNEIEYREYTIDGRCLRKSSVSSKLSFSTTLAEVILSMTELTIASKSQLERNKALRSDPDCFYLE